MSQRLNFHRFEVTIDSQLLPSLCFTFNHIHLTFLRFLRDRRIDVTWASGISVNTSVVQCHFFVRTKAELFLFTALLVQVSLSELAFYKIRSLFRLPFFNWMHLTLQTQLTALKLRSQLKSNLPLTFKLLSFIYLELLILTIGVIAVWFTSLFLVWKEVWQLIPDFGTFLKLILLGDENGICYFPFIRHSFQLKLKLTRKALHS